MKKIIVFGIICLFVGVGFQPVFAVESRVSDDKVEKEEDCDCQEVDSLTLIRVKLLFTQLKIATNILLSRFGHIPEVEEKCKELLDIIDSNGQLGEPHPIIFCNILENLLSKMESTFSYLEQILIRLVEKYGLIVYILSSIFLAIILPPFLVFRTVAHNIGHKICGWPESPT